MLGGVFEIDPDDIVALDAQRRQMGGAAAHHVAKPGMVDCAICGDDGRRPGPPQGILVEGFGEIHRVKPLSAPCGISFPPRAFRRMCPPAYRTPNPKSGPSRPGS